MLRTLAGGHHRDHHHVDAIRTICRVYDLVNFVPHVCSARDVVHIAFRRGSRLRLASGGDDGLIRMLVAAVEVMNIRKLLLINVAGCIMHRWQADVTRRPDEEDVVTPRQAVGEV